MLVAWLGLMACTVGYGLKGRSEAEAPLDEGGGASDTEGHHDPTDDTTDTGGPPHHEDTSRPDTGGPNDTGGATDTGEPKDTGLVDLEGCTDRLAIPKKDHYEVTFKAAADDAWEAWIDGSTFGGGTYWPTPSTLTATLDPGCHVFAVHAQDVYGVISGLVASVTVDGTVVNTTGDLQWVVSPTTPPADWTDAAFETDASWTTPPACTDTAPWGDYPADIKAEGAQWVWTSADCHTLGEGWFRVGLALP